MPLPAADSPEAIMLLQRALGHVTVDGVIGAQTVKAVKRANAGGLNAALERVLVAEHGSPDQDFIGAVLRRVPA
jgi:lysozyme family protein